MQFIKGIIGSSLLLFSLSVFATEDSLCKRLARFANSAKQDDPLSVYVVTDWGNFTKSCAKRDGNKPESDLCDWMIQNISMEFMYVNVSRVMQCLSGQKDNMFSGTLNFSHSTGEFSAYEAPNINSNTVVKVAYSFGMDGELPHLKIIAERFKD